MPKFPPAQINIPRGHEDIIITAPIKEGGSPAAEAPARGSPSPPAHPAPKLVPAVGGGGRPSGKMVAGSDKVGIKFVSGKAGDKVGIALVKGSSTRVNGAITSVGGMMMFFLGLVFWL